ncbi:Dolichyl-phosphate-mannose-protein mannosyltransferase 2 [Smittium culicis]|uniref:Dolichyl-phosphate-mannose--protein mannosyltransferase n=1 Tax=Smittium culicis TaxID=133412 RepID=A0A1R1YAX5_9FUNG|nr:Dolichyl-phosphate-mannose-protein mannosyltransferase 2 [Smittium culicis]
MSVFQEYLGSKKPSYYGKDIQIDANAVAGSIFYYYEIENLKKTPHPSKTPAPKKLKVNNFLLAKTWCLNNLDIVLTIVITFFSLFTRTYRIGDASRVIWDEAHFGKFGGYYVKGEFYHDVHPPLAKMLVGLSEYLTGFNGKFRFESGKDFPEDTNFVFMRIFNAMFGTLMAPLAYHTMRNFRCNMRTSFLAALFVITDNATCTISRFILLDGILLCFTSLSLYSLSGFYHYRSQPFSKMWYFFLALTGVSLGLVSSSKWVGLFAVALVGLYTIEELYNILGDTKTSMKKYAYHWIARAVFLIVVPLSIYLLCFKIHFALLYKSGKGDSVMPSIFQAGLEGSSLGTQPYDLAYGSVVSIKAPGEHGLLHSHPSKYPDESFQQQITCYGHNDENNDFQILKPVGVEFDAKNGPIEFVKDGSVIRLFHKNTNNTLVTSTKFNGSLTKKYFQTFAIANHTDFTTPQSEEWIIEVVSDDYNSKDKIIHSLTTQFRLKHVVTGCYLRVSGKNYPEWGFKQSEVVCGIDKSGTDDDLNTIWNIDIQKNKRLPNGDRRKLRSNFLKNFIHLNKAMNKSNNALTPDEDKIDDLTSSPLDWPILRLGLRMCSYGDDEIKFFLLGNPLLWWLSFALIILYTVQIFYYLILYKRGYENFTSANYLYPATILWLGWFLHYIPFFIMGRVTYLHHYFPCIYFAVLFTAFQLDHFATVFRRNKYIREYTIPFIGTLSVLIFIYFSPMTFGFDYPGIDLKYRRWLSTWKIY